MVDTEAYLEVVHETWQHLDSDSLEALVHVGWLLRAASAIPGETRSLESDWPSRVIGKMSFYRQKLAHAMQGLSLEPTP